MLKLLLSLNINVNSNFMGNRIIVVLALVDLDIISIPINNINWIALYLFKYVSIHKEFIKSIHGSI